MTKGWWVRCLLGNPSAHVFECRIRRAALPLGATAPVQNIRHARVCCRSECTASPIGRPSLRRFTFRLYRRNREHNGATATLLSCECYQLPMSAILTTAVPFLLRCFEASAFKKVMDILRPTSTRHSRPFPLPFDTVQPLQLDSIVQSNENHKTESTEK
jgi:hypothetical protein